MSFKEFILILVGMIVLVIGSDIRDQLADMANPQQVQYEWCVENLPRVVNHSAENIDQVCVMEALK